LTGVNREDVAGFLLGEGVTYGFAVGLNPWGAGRNWGFRGVVMLLLLLLLLGNDPLLPKGEWKFV
jgi:hypothetical protein